MRDYLLKKYQTYGDKGKVFNVQYVMQELLCSNSVALLRIKQTLNSQKVNFTRDEFIRIIEVSLDLEN